MYRLVDMKMTDAIVFRKLPFRYGSTIDLMCASKASLLY